MFSIVKKTFVVFLCIASLTMLLVLAKLGQIWFFENRGNSEYLGWLLMISVAEVIGVVIILARKGLKYLPDVEIHKEEKETLCFMKRFIDTGSTVQIVSSRFTWVKNSQQLFDEIKKKANDGDLIEIITPEKVAENIRMELEEAGVKFYVTGDRFIPEARFTLINGNRSGAERLAIARGTHPEHEVTIFDNHSGPQIVGMAKDIIRKSKEATDASKMG